MAVSSIPDSATAQAFWKTNGDLATYRYATDNLKMTHAEIAQTLGVSQADVDKFATSISVPVRSNQPGDSTKKDSIQNVETKSAAPIHVTTPSGKTITPADAQTARQNLGNAGAYKLGRSEGLSNAQIAAVTGIDVNVINEFETALTYEEIHNNAKDELDRNFSVQTYDGGRVTRHEAKALVAADGAEAAFRKGQAAGLDNAQIAQLLEIPKEAVDAFETSLWQKVDKPSETLTPSDLSDLEDVKSEDQLYVALLWGLPERTDISDSETKARVKELISTLGDEAPYAILAELLQEKMPIPQFLRAMKDEPGFSPEAVNQLLVDQFGIQAPDHWKKLVDQSINMNARLILDKKGLTGLDGTGVTVRVLESTPGIHGDMVSAIVNHPQFGLAPGAEVERDYLSTEEYDFSNRDADVEEYFKWLFNQELSRLVPAPDEAGPFPEEATALRDAFESTISRYFASSWDGIAERVKDFTKSDAQVLNMSMGVDFVGEINVIHKVASELLEQSPQLSRALYEEQPGMTPEQLNQKIIDFISDATFNSPEVAQAHAAYQAVTKEAADEGKVIIVSAGNNQALGRALGNYQLSSLATYGNLAMSDYIIGVGASQTNGTPKDVRDDTLTNFSSHGGGRYTPTVIAQGQDVAVPYPLSVDALGRVNGTSFSAPTVAATVALLLQDNPNMTFNEVKAWLQANAVDIGVSTSAQGAGVLDLVGAAQRAG